MRKKVINEKNAKKIVQSTINGKIASLYNQSLELPSGGKKRKLIYFKLFSNLNRMLTSYMNALYD